MRIRRPCRPAVLYRALLRGAALFVPRSERQEWLAEWQSELWYFWQDRSVAIQSFTRLSLSTTRFCLGSWRDALWMRHNSPDTTRRERLWLRSPLQCMTVLVLLAVLTWSVALFESVLQPPYLGYSFLVGQVFVLGTALFLLRISTPVTLGGYPVTRHSSAPGTRLRWWIFLGAKIALLLPIVFCGTLALGPPMASTGMSPHATLIGYVLGFRWVFQDQRRRCPVCLRLLTNPVRIGQPSYHLLEWYGTELMCSQGHGLLHVPETPTSSYSAPSWLSLDPSWRGLFL